MGIDLVLIVKSMRFSALGCTLITLQVLLSITVVVNAVSASRWLSSQLTAETGIVTQDLLYIAVLGFGRDFTVGVDSDADLNLIRQQPNVVNAIQTNAIPLSNSGWYSSLRTTTEPNATSVNAARYMVDENAIETLGLEILAGRNFMPSEVVWLYGPKNALPSSLMLTEDLAKELYPELTLEEVLGQIVYYDGDHGANVVAILRMMPQPDATNSNLHRSFLVPQKIASTNFRYLVRAEPGYLESLIPELEQLLAKSNPDRLITTIRTLEDTHRQSTNGNLIVVALFWITTILLTATTMLSIVGVGNFNIRRRIQQISIRRVLGATKWRIVRHFLVENAVVMLIGVVFGTVLAVLCNIVLVESAEFPKLDWLDLTIPTLIFVVLGAGSVLATSIQTLSYSLVPR